LVSPNQHHDAILILSHPSLYFMHRANPLCLSDSNLSPLYIPPHVVLHTCLLSPLALRSTAQSKAKHCVEMLQKQLAGMVENASIEDVMKVLMASRKQDLHQLWTTCSHLVAKSGLPPEVLAKHLPIDVVAKIDELRLKSSLTRRSPFLAHHHPAGTMEASSAAAELDDHHKIRRMRRALDSSDVELVKLMVMGEGLNLDEALALHYAVENCSREVVKALLELGAADVNHPAGPAGKTPLHVAAEMVCPDMVAVLLDHHADPNVHTVDGVTPLDILRTLTSDFLFKGAVPGLTHIEPNKLRLCLELVQSAAMVMSREDAHTAAVAVNAAPMYSEPPGGGGHGYNNASGTNTSMVTNLSLDNRMVYLNLGMDAQFSKMNDGGEEDDSGGRGQGGSSSLFSPHGYH
jgi:regulatory protein NPR1